MKDISAGLIGPCRKVKDKTESEMKAEIKDKVLEYYDGRNDVEITVVTSMKSLEWIQLPLRQIKVESKQWIHIHVTL